jgi:ankyrin repeat protein
MRSESEQFLDKLLLEASVNSSGAAKYLAEDGQEYEITIDDLILSGADPDICYVENGLTPIMLCALRQNLEGYEILADISNFEIQSAGGSTILHHAIQGGSDEIIDDIISRAPEMLDTKNSRNETPTMRAVNCGRENALEMLLRAGVDPNSYSQYEGMEMCILAHAISCGQMNMVKLLIQYGAWVDHVIYDSESQQNDATLLEWCFMKNKNPLLMA